MSAARIEVRVQAACFDGGRLLCARHRRHGREYWVLPGGHVDPGETLWAGAARELAEEAGLELRAGRLWAVGEFLDGDRHVVECTFLVTQWRGEAEAGHDPEAEHPASLVGLAWLDRARFERESFLPPRLRRRLLEWWDDPAAPAEYLEPDA